MKPRLLPWLALLCAFGLVAAACGGSDDGADGEPSAPTVAEEAPDTTDAVTVTDDDPDGDDGTTGDGGDTTGDAAGDGTTAIDRTGEVIRVGYVNNEGGVISLPELRTGGEVAIATINASGGIHGAMIEPVVCLSDTTPEGAINCAVKLIEEDVVLAYMGLELASEAAIHLWLDAGIPYISSNSWGPTERNSPGAFLLHAASGAYAVGPAKTFAELGIDHIAVISQDSPTGLDFLDNIIAPVLRHNGITMERVVVDAAAPDWTAAIAAVQSAGVEGVMGQLDEFGCIGMIAAAAASGFDKPIFAGSCTAYINLLGPAAVGTYTQGDLWIPSIAEFAPPEIQERLAAFRQEMEAAGYGGHADGFAIAPYSAWREMEFILEMIEGPITAESVTAAFANAGETPGWLGPNLRCGEAPWPAESSHCGSEIMVWQIIERDDGTLGRVPVGDGFFDAFEYSGF
ncbi:ABC transporter substrate-binding protein [Candidatus Poriferisodalis sp.]|uniref:ABC transporter substrate-binding protein n=1 Tax=Candidatus Poriferisodalis sp. TaxID=3101277 RepID=UPI003D14876F